MFDFLNLFYYHVKRISWTSRIDSIFRDYNHVQINRPVFFVGNQGDGLTLISRMIRRSDRVVSVTGNSDYWSGADEMHRVMLPRLTWKLQSGGPLMGYAPPHSLFKAPRSWTYASDDLIDQYRLTDEDFDRESSECLKKVIRECIHRFGKERNARFVDKSQTYTVKISFINQLLSGCNPHFVLITRNPYATCYRAATRKAPDLVGCANELDVLDRVKIASQHWNNSMSYALEDGRETNFKWFRFEDVLANPSKKINQICNFIGIEYNDDMIPSPNDDIPFGTKYPNRWFPLREEVNSKHLRSAPREAFDIVHHNCSAIAEALGYPKPTP